MSSSLSLLRRRLALGLSGLMLATGLSGAWLFYNGLKNSQAEALNRHVEDLASYARSDILATISEHAQAQHRKAQRLARIGLIDPAGWRADARLFKVHYPYYRSIAVLHPDLRIQWLEGAESETMTEGHAYPVSEDYLKALTDSALSGMPVVARPRLLPDGKAGLTFINPIGTGDQHLGFLAAVLSVPDAVDAMVSDMFRDELVLRVTADNNTIYPFPPLDDASRFEWSSTFSFNLDGDGEMVLFELGISDLGRRQLGTMLPAVALASGIAGSFLIAIIAYLGLNASHQTRVLRRSNRRLEEEIHDRRAAERELEFLVTHDRLTGLPNRTGSTRYLECALNELEDKQGQFALMFLDLDQFKDINDSLGHQLGDRLLCEIPSRLAAVLKDRDFVGRHGGDEFLIAARRANREQIEQLAMTILRSMDPGFVIDDNRFFVSASIGIAYYPESGRSVSELIQNADAALFKAKNAGRNQFAVFTREMFSQAQHRLNLSRDIRHALDAGQFRLVYQPIVSLQDLSLCGLEALLRWEHEKGYMVPPQDFIRVAEETGIIGRLGEFAMAQALSDLAHWKSLTEHPPWLAVNISGAQIREGGFAQQLSVLLHQYRIEPQLLHLEITEEILIENLMRNRRMLQKLDDIGMRVVVDDFGVGYSSLAYLKNFPISVVKIDRGFVKDLATDAEDQAITRTICSLASDLGMLTVAEGVETEEQLKLLREFRCSFAQGYLFSRPVAAAGVVAMLDQQPTWSRRISA